MSYRGHHHNYASSRSYARANCGKTRADVSRAYLDRRGKETEKGRSICASLEVGDPVFYCHEDGFCLNLRVTGITPDRITTVQTDGSGRVWAFGGVKSLYPAKHGNCHVTWPAMLELDDHQD